MSSIGGNILTSVVNGCQTKAQAICQRITRLCICNYGIACRLRVASKPQLWHQYRKLYLRICTIISFVPLSTHNYTFDSLTYLLQNTHHAYQHPLLRCAPRPRRRYCCFLTKPTFHLADLHTSSGSIRPPKCLPWFRICPRPLRCRRHPKYFRTLSPSRRRQKLRGPQPRLCSQRSSKLLCAVRRLDPVVCH